MDIWGFPKTVIRFKHFEVDFKAKADIFQDNPGLIPSLPTSVETTVFQDCLYVATQYRTICSINYLTQR